ncbi:MAG: phosphatidate cytidylyltransferase [Vicinamibacteria bacterium]|nr:phosphatidate cytidylyltransferase [Vicinamibacteria bacterium]
MREPAQTAVELVATIFGLAALWIGLAQAKGRLMGRRIWTTYVVEILTLAAILVPAYLGPWWFLAAVSAIGLACAIEAARALGRMGLAGLTLLYPGLFLGALFALGAAPTGFGDVFFCYAAVEINDSSAYLIGATFGKARPFPALSPNKTVAGLVGGLVTTIAMAPLFHFAVPSLSREQVLIGGGFLAGAGTAGDLFASSIKRAARIKDFGAVIPTHGGVLDVYDSLIFVAPLFQAYLWACRAE